MPKSRTQALTAPPPFPCPSCAAAGAVLIPIGVSGEPCNLEREGASSWHCSASCGFAVERRTESGEERCPGDGAPLTFDPSIVGETVGNLRLRGWNRCDHCGGVWLTRRGVPDSGGRGDGRWRLAAGGRSLDAGGVRLRAEKGAADLATLMARISRMPAFESALERIASGELDADAMRQLAADALSIADGVEEIDA